jgi:hypothetical protein
MAYQMQDFRYAEYVKFCEAESIEPVAYEKYDHEFLWKFCRDHKIPNSVWDLGGLGWCEEPEPGYTHWLSPETDPALLNVHKMSRHILPKASKAVTGRR